MIKKYADFIKESHSKSVKLTPEEVSLFTSEPLLQKLIADKKVSLYDNEVKFDETDHQTKEVLDQYLEIPGKVEESLLNEDKKDVTDMYVTIDNYKNHILNIETEDGKKYLTNLETFDDFDEYEDDGEEASEADYY